MRDLVYYGGVPVPYAASWSTETEFSVAPCRFAGGRLAICQNGARGVGKPLFGKPHAVRQRDLCAKPLRVRTKVSLSHARPQLHSARGGEILQVEPLLHRECAAVSMRHCPALKRDIALGTLMVRQVTRHQIQLAIMTATYTQTIAGAACPAIGHAKVQLQAWVDRDADWLLAAQARGVG